MSEDPIEDAYEKYIAPEPSPSEPKSEIFNVVIDQHSLLQDVGIKLDFDSQQDCNIGPLYR